MLIGATPPAALADWRYRVVPTAAGLATFFLHPQLSRMERVINVFDAFGLGLFSVAGALKATDYGLSPLPAVLLGVMTGVGGGVLRDVLARRIPTVLQRGELYAIPAIAGAAVVVTGRHLGVPTGLIAALSSSLTILWRLLAIWRGWTAPEPARSQPSL